MFSWKTKYRLLRSLIFRKNPAYVQFYITARCNLTCEQCNIIYANSDLPEVGIEGIRRIAANLSELGVAIVLLTGGEPFMRKDLPDIISAFVDVGIHVRIQTNGFASEDMIKECISRGARDISISLDSLEASKQDLINGGFPTSWDSALKAISLFNKYLPKNSFSSFGCVLSKNNHTDILDVVKFGSQIGWHTSLVPIHVSDLSKPQGFRTSDQSLSFTDSEAKMACATVDSVREMRDQGFLLYDSDQYLDDIKRFVSGHRITWRDRNAGVCDSPDLYFAILPNGEFAPCCDHRLEEAVDTSSPHFVSIFRSSEFHDNVGSKVSKCDGCMYGSYPEITISLRFASAIIQRIFTFGFRRKRIGTLNPFVAYHDLKQLAEKILRDRKGNIIVSDAKES